ncbi:hypothetical protein NBCG_01021 [Nocardioidaceae bacterium Broad-1]|nr:hypothetical protein NBCG_01021 [Nocardioidaceae bacterium Broad-1]
MSIPFGPAAVAGPATDRRATTSTRRAAALRRHPPPLVEPPEPLGGGVSRPTRFRRATRGLCWSRHARWRSRLDRRWAGRGGISRSRPGNDRSWGGRPARRRWPG